VLDVGDEVLERIVAHCLSALPHEGCGLLVGDVASGLVAYAAGMENAARSALTYELDPAEQLRVTRDADDAGLDVIGAFHSHTHTDAWPSPTDVAKAVDPAWHWLIVSLRRPEPLVRSFRIDGGAVAEEEVHVGGGMRPVGAGS
jgi:proteasome lid subunit RPN8/RPN11